MKKIGLFLTAIALMVVLSACNSDKETLYVLNWGEYMDMELVEQFEDEYNVRVVYDEVGSNEEMEVKIKAGTTKYDVAFPSDYMIDKLRQQNLLHEIDFDKLTGFDNVTIKTEVANLTADKGYNDYFVPYFWGTVGIMYNTNEVTESDLTGWDVLFDPDTTYKIGMYDSARDASAAALLYLGYDVNTNDATELDEAEQALEDANFNLFGEDNLKGLVVSGNLDMALVYSGDYFDTLYIAEEDGDEVNFAYFVPETTNVWVDGFVIPTTSENTDLAHDFINFFLDEEVSAQNADWVGYAPVLDEVYNLLVSDEYGYDYDNYNPYPTGSTRVIYEFISDERFSRLNELLDAAKAN
jgi:spermidine/putrescine-binding protein